MNDSKLLTETLRLGELGHRVFPLKAGTKNKPLTKHGCLDASSDPDQIRRWWAKNPDANIGLSTDALWVVDVDGSDHPWLSDELRGIQLSQAGAIASTPRGGKHYLFRMPDGEQWPGDAPYFDENVDARGWHNYIVVAPSVTADGEYAWRLPLDVPAGELPLPPTAFYPDKKIKKPSAAVAVQPLLNGSPRAGNIAEFTAQTIVKEGGRDNYLTSFAGRLIKGGMSQQETINRLQHINAETCDPPMRDDEVLRIVNLNYERWTVNDKKTATDEVPIPTGPEWSTLEELFEADDFQHGIPVISTEFSELDETLGGGLEAGGLYVLGAKTGDGKTSFALNMLRRVALGGTKCLLVKIEESKRDALACIYSAASGVPKNCFRQGVANMTPTDRAKVEDARKLLRGVPLRITDNRYLDDVVRVCRDAVKGGAQLIAIDQLNLIQVRGATSAYEKITLVSNTLRLLAVDLMVPIFVLCQVNRTAGQEDKPLDLASLRDSGHLENDASAVIFLKSETVVTGGEPKKTLLVTLAKNRNGPLVKDADALRFDFWPATRRIESSWVGVL